MPRIKLAWATCLALAWLLLAAPAGAAQEQAATLTEAKGQVVWSVTAKVKRLFDSYTSYEFGDTYPPYPNPLSRLEFALNSWWGGLGVSRWTPRWSISLEAMRNLTSGVDGPLADSDWLDDQDTSLRTVYSESSLRMKPSYDVRASLDVSMGSWRGQLGALDLRPVGGVRWQRFDLLAYNVNQWNLEPDGSKTYYHDQGDAIRFRQTYWHYFIGLRTAWQPMLREHPGFLVRAQVDWAYVHGSNKDHHLMRGGFRITEETTNGHAWHASLALEAPLGYNFFLGVEAEYLRLTTTGNHRWQLMDYDVDETWSYGVKVWSQQASLMATLRYAF